MLFYPDFNNHASGNCVYFSGKKVRQELVGPRSNCGNKIQNGRHINKGKIQRITISSGPCGKLVSTKWGVPELKVDNIMFY